MTSTTVIPASASSGSSRRAASQVPSRVKVPMWISEMTCPSSSTPAPFLITPWKTRWIDDLGRPVRPLRLKPRHRIRERLPTIQAETIARARSCPTHESGEVAAALFLQPGGRGLRAYDNFHARPERGPDSEMDSLPGHHFRPHRKAAAGQSVISTGSVVRSIASDVMALHVSFQGQSRHAPQRPDSRFGVFPNGSF